RRHRQARREDGHRGRLRAGAEADGDHRRLLRGRELLDVRARLLAAVPVDVAQCAHLGDGRGAGGLGAGDRARRSARRRRRPVDGRGGRTVQGAAARAVRDPGRALLLHRPAVGRRGHRPGRHPHRALTGPGGVCQRPARAGGLRRFPDVRTMTTTRFHTVLVANRGEIAVRVIATLQRLGIRAVAVYSDADEGARHVAEADTAVRLGPAPAAESYLSVEKISAAALATGAQAIHPGYGFLSENPALPAACAAAGLVFIGPGAAAIETMGDKIAAKTAVAAGVVPVVPGIAEPGLSDAQLIDAAA